MFRFEICVAIFATISAHRLDATYELTRENYSLDVNNLVNTVIDEYFANDRCVVVIGREEDMFSITSIKLMLVLISIENPCNDSTLFESIVYAIDSGCYSYVVISNRPKCVLEAWKEAQFSFSVPTMRRGTPKMFTVLVNSTEAEVDEFFSFPETELSSDIVAAVVTDDQEWPIILYTNNFYEPTEAGLRIPKLYLDRWETTKGFELGVELYYDKIRDLRGKSIKVAVVAVLPYSQISPFVGMEAEIMKSFCWIHNCNIEVLTDDGLWGDIFSNGTGVGVIGMVFNGEADVGLAGIYMWPWYFNHTQFSTSYMQSGVTVIVPKPKIIGGWLIPFLPFTLSLWFAYIISTCATGVCMYIITVATIKYTRFAEEVKQRKMFLTLGDTIFRSLGLSVLQQPSKPLVPHTPIRHLFTAFEILNLIISATYAAKLASFLTVPQYSEPIDTLAQLAESGQLWAGEHCAWVFSLLEVDTPVAKTVVKNFQVANLENLGELAAQGYGIPIERLAGGHYIERDFIAEETVIKSHVMAEYLYHSQLILLLRKASPYEKPVNKLIGRVRDHGLLLYWEAEAARRYMSGRRQAALNAARKINVEEGARQLSVSDCLGMFVLYFAGNLISIVVFIGEHITAQRKPPAMISHYSLK